MPAEQVRLRIGNLDRAVLITGQAYQDPKDALNEFISNAADEYAEADRRGGRITVFLRRQGRHPLVAVDDAGRGMDVARLRRVAGSLFDSSKAGDPRTLGEKAIGLLAFQQLGARCEVVTRPEGEARTHVLRLERGRSMARLELDERRRARVAPGTTVYLADLDPDVVRVLTLRKVVDYLRRRRAVALARGDYSLEVVEGRRAELVTPERPDGVRLALPSRPTLWGRVEYALFVAPRPDHRRRVAVVGRAGTTIIDDLCELEEFGVSPWGSDQVSGQVTYEALVQTAGRRAILRDRDAFPAFVEAVRAVEPAVQKTLERIAAALDRDTAERLSDAVRRIFARVLRELADLDNPMRTALGTETGDGAVLATLALAEASDGEALPAGSALDVDLDLPALQRPAELTHPPDPPADPGVGAALAGGRRSRALPSIEPDPDPGPSRSRFDPERGLVYYNAGHPDFLLVKDEESGLLDYLATLVAKEYVVFNNPRARADELAEEMVRMLVRVRRHLRQRR